MADQTFDQFIANMTALVGRVWFDKIAIDAADQVGLRMVEIALDEYPPEPPAKPTPKGKSPIHTPKQKRWWWAMMHNIADGKVSAEGVGLRGWKAAYKTVQGRKTLVISGGYKRTGTGIRSMTHQVRPIRNGLEIGVGPSMARNDKGGGYMKYVLDVPPPEGEQAAIHQGRWIPIATLMNKHGQELTNMFVAEVMKGVRKRLSGG